jgi:hypothetical protein
VVAPGDTSSSIHFSLERSIVSLIAASATSSPGRPAAAAATGNVSAPDAAPAPAQPPSAKISEKLSERLNPGRIFGSARTGEKLNPGQIFRIAGGLEDRLTPRLRGDWEPRSGLGVINV